MSTTTATHSNGLTVQDIIAGYDNEQWLGFGYLGERASWLDTQDPEVESISPERIAEVDAAILREANRRRWMPITFFRWLNSRDGRHFADAAFGCDMAVTPEKVRQFFR
jgi:hypothetical protein